MPPRKPAAGLALLPIEAAVIETDPISKNNTDSRDVTRKIQTLPRRHFRITPEFSKSLERRRGGYLRCSTVSQNRTQAALACSQHSRTIARKGSGKCGAPPAADVQHSLFGRYLPRALFSNLDYLDGGKLNLACLRQNVPDSEREIWRLLGDRCDRGIHCLNSYGDAPW